MEHKTDETPGKYFVRSIVVAVENYYCETCGTVTAQEVTDEGDGWERRRCPCCGNSKAVRTQ